MEFPNPFSKKGLWLKGNIHTHTTQSDGEFTPRQIAREYGKRGYDFVFLTDHWKRTVPPADLSAPPLLIPSEEIDFFIGSHLFHVVCLGIGREMERREFQSLNDLVRMAESEGFSLVMAHPYWLGNPSGLYQCSGEFLGLEIFNTVCDALIAKGYSTVHWDDILDSGKRVFGFAADDLHAAELGLGRGWIAVKAESCTEQAVLKALREGYFYSTQGPEIKNVTIHGNRIRVTCSAVRRIHFIGNRNRGRVVRAAEGELTEASWNAWPDCTYVRIECVDEKGKTAWTNPIFFD